MNLTPEEQRAVEAACEWDRNVKSVATPSEQRLVTGVKAQMVGREVDAQQVVAGVAIGYLDGDRDGFKRGVEAAMHRQCGGCRDGEPFHPKKKDHHQGKQYDYLCGAVLFRALLAQEEKP